MQNHLFFLGKEFFLHSGIQTSTNVMHAGGDSTLCRAGTIIKALDCLVLLKCDKLRQCGGLFCLSCEWIYFYQLSTLTNTIVLQFKPKNQDKTFLSMQTKNNDAVMTVLHWSYQFFCCI